MAQYKRGPCRDEVTIRLTLDELIALKNICRIANEEAYVNGVPRRFEKFFIEAEEATQHQIGSAEVLK